MISAIKRRLNRMYERVSEMKRAVFEYKNEYTSGRKRNWGVKAILYGNAGFWL